MLEELQARGNEERQGRLSCAELRPQETSEEEIAVSDANEPVAWAVALGGDRFIIDGIFLRRTQAEEACAWRNEHTTYGSRIIPLYEKPQPTLTDEEREALARVANDASYRAMERTERVVRGLLDRSTHMATARLAAANTWLQEEIKRLSLTDAEREAVEWAVAAASDCEHPAEATLRSLLERTK